VGGNVRYKKRATGRRTGGNWGKEKTWEETGQGGETGQTPYSQLRAPKDSAETQKAIELGRGLQGGSKNETGIKLRATRYALITRFGCEANGKESPRAVNQRQKTAKGKKIGPKNPRRRGSLGKKKKPPWGREKKRSCPAIGLCGHPDCPGEEKK